MTEMRDIDDLLPEVMMHAPACPEPVALKHIRDAAREFCARTRMWREQEILTVSTPECEAIWPHQDVRIVGIERSMLDGYPLEAKTIGWLDANVPRWTAYDGASVARYITQLNHNTVTVVPKVAGQLDVRLVLQPSRDATTIPEFLVEDFGSEIGAAAAGERARVFEAAVLKTIGATRGRILASFALRSALMGAAAASVAVFAAVLASWLVLTRVMDLSYTFEPLSALLIIAGGVLATLLAGLAFALRPLAARPARILRAQE